MQEVLLNNLWTRAKQQARKATSAYNAWVTIIDSDGKPNNGPFKASRTCVMLDAKTLELTYGFDFYMYGQFMKFVPRGAIRIDSGKFEREFAHVAFKNPDGSFVLVVVNPKKEARQSVISWNGKILKAELPSQSVVTYRWNGSSNHTSSALN